MQLHATKAAFLGEGRDAIANALGALVAILAVAVVRDAVAHQNVLMEHRKAICHLAICQQIDTYKVGLLFDGRLAPGRRDWLGTWNALLFVLVQVECSP